MPLNWIWTDHIRYQMDERDILKEVVELAINSPDEIVEGKQNRLIYQKIVGNKLVRVITEDNRLLTVYLTAKINKYLKGKDK